MLGAEADEEQAQSLTAPLLFVSRLEHSLPGEVRAPVLIRMSLNRTLFGFSDVLLVHK